jgi:hypothetical protein
MAKPDRMTEKTEADTTYAEVMPAVLGRPKSVRICRIFDAFYKSVIKRAFQLYVKPADKNLSTKQCVL